MKLAKWFLLTVQTVRCQNDKPNVIILLADDLGIGDIGAYNSKSKVPTPNLDALAKKDTFQSFFEENEYS